MRLRMHRRNLVVWSSSAGLAGRYDGPTFIRAGVTGRVHRLVRTAALLTVISLMVLVGFIRPRWRLLLAGLVLTVTGLLLRGSTWDVVLLPGLLLLLSAPLIPAGRDDDHRRLERELATYSTQIQRRDLEATLDRYPDTITHEVRDILAGQVVAACGDGIPGAGRPRPRPQPLLKFVSLLAALPRTGWRRRACHTAPAAGVAR